MKVHSIYKLKDNKSNNLFDEYVYTESLASNPILPISKKNTYVTYRSVDIDNQKYDKNSILLKVLPCTTFKKHFKLHMKPSQVSKLFAKSISG